MRTRTTVLLLVVLAGCGISDERVREIIRTERAEMTEKEFITSAQVVGPYSPAIRAGDMLFVSGQLGLDPATGDLAGSSIESQTRQALENLMAVLRQAGFDSSHVVQCTVFLTDMDDFQSMNLMYGGYFPMDRYPARSTVEVSHLPRGGLIEIAAIAMKECQP